MTRKQWRKLKKGSYVATKSGKPRRVIKTGIDSIVLKVIRGGYVKLFLGSRVNVKGRSHTTYCLSADRKIFQVISY